MLCRQGFHLKFSQAQRQNSIDALGNKTKAWTNLGSTFRVDLRDVGSQEQEYAGGTNLVQQYDCLARYGSIEKNGVKTSDHLVIDSRTFNISSMRNEAERNQVITMTIEEIV